MKRETETETRQPASNQEAPEEKPSAWQAFWIFLKLGLTSFGGPVAHLGFFRDELVVRRKWLSENSYADLIALCQFLPGPASSQVGFALGYQRAGLSGALAAWLGFTLPSALIMIGCAYGLAYVETDAAWLHGLKIAAVAVVAQAVWSMALKLCPDRSRATIALVAAGVVLAVGTAWIQIAVIAAGLLLGRGLFRAQTQQAPPPADTTSPYLRKGRIAHAALALVFLGFIVFPILAWTTQDLWWEMVDGFYRSGLLVFGGGHVILPLLEAETVGLGWMERDAFLAGYGAAQALPGPLFTFAAYLGTVIAPGDHAWVGGLVCLIAILIPSMLLVIGVLPHWESLRKRSGARAALMGANAVVVGILLAAFYDPVFTSAIDSTHTFIIALAAFAALHFWKLPPWALVLACALAGAVVL